jgi:hypothetical protein
MTRLAVSAIVLGLVIVPAVGVSAADQQAGRDENAAQRAKLQKERIEVLTRLVSVDEAQYRTGEIPCEDLIGAETDLVNAQVEAADKPGQLPAGRAGRAGK